MQLLLALDNRLEKLIEIDRRLRRHLGPQGPFWLLEPVSQMAMAIIGGKTHSEISKAAFGALLLRFGTCEAVRDAPVGEIEETISAVTFAELKALRLKAALQTVTTRCGRLTLEPLDDMTVGEALAWLESLPGVGRKVAAATLNFSTLRKPVLVIDSHQLRILKRLGFVGRRATLRQAHEQVAPLLPSTWPAAELDEHHQLMKTLGRTICRHDAPLCRRCPLADLCPTAPPRRTLRHRPAERITRPRQSKAPTATEIASAAAL